MEGVSFGGGVVRSTGSEELGREEWNEHFLFCLWRSCQGFRDQESWFSVELLVLGPSTPHNRE